jgi:hypothetical protein
MRVEVEANDRQPFHSNAQTINPDAKLKERVDVRLSRQSEQANRDSQPFDAGLDATDTSLSIL